MAVYHHALVLINGTASAAPACRQNGRERHAHHHRPHQHRLPALNYVSDSLRDDRVSQEVIEEPKPCSTASACTVSLPVLDTLSLVTTTGLKTWKPAFGSGRSIWYCRYHLTGC